MREEDKELYEAFLAAAGAISRIQPMTPSTRYVLRRYFHGFEAAEVSSDVLGQYLSAYTCPVRKGDPAPSSSTVKVT
jgi:hypothetical protein